MDDTTRPNLDDDHAGGPTAAGADVLERLARIEAQITVIARALEFVTTVLTVLASKYAPLRKAIEVAAAARKD